MEFKDFLFWKKQKQPQDIIKENLGDLYVLAKQVAFSHYKSIIEWRIHNVAENHLRRPEFNTEYDKGYVDGLRLLLKDFKKIEEEGKKREEELNKEK
jgi:hypothetical protein